MSRRRGLAATAAAAIVLAACATSSRQAAMGGSPGGAAQDTSASGTIRVVGAAPRMVVALDSGGTRVALTGDLAAELATLDGAEVTVRGSVGTSPVPIVRAGRAITVREYDIAAIGGRKPVVGVLIADSAGVRVDSVALSGTPARLLALACSKVWVIGERAPSGAVQVETYGVLRRAVEGHR